MKLRRTLIMLIILFGMTLLVYFMTAEVSTRESVQFPMNSSYQDTGDYAIDPDTILSDIDQGKTDVFRTIYATSTTQEFESYKSIHSVSYHWSQSDYLKVASALHRFVWNENLNNWHIFSMYFHIGCQDNPTGFDSAKITYFKGMYGPLSYTTRVLDIYPVDNGVSWGGKANFPHPIFGWRSVDLKKIKVTADDALELTEANGGQEFRLRVNNNCTIDVFINPNPGQDDDWIVYYDSKGLSTFELHIDPYTGEFEIQH